MTFLEFLKLIRDMYVDYFNSLKKKPKQWKYIKKDDRTGNYKAVKK